MKNPKGTTLLELIIAMGIIITGLLTLVGLIVRSINLSTRSKNEIIGLGLAQEGIEAVRNIRDANYLENEAGASAIPWDYNLSGAIFNPREYSYIAIPVFDFNRTAAGGASQIAITPWSLYYGVSGFTDTKAIVAMDKAAVPTKWAFYQDIINTCATPPCLDRMPSQFRRVLAIIPLCVLPDGDPRKIDQTTLTGTPLLIRDDLFDRTNVTAVRNYFTSLTTTTATCVPQQPKVGVRIISRVEWNESAKKPIEDIILTQDLYDWR